MERELEAGQLGKLFHGIDGRRSSEAWRHWAGYPIEKARYFCINWVINLSLACVCEHGWYIVPRFTKSTKISFGAFGVGGASGVSPLASLGAFVFPVIGEVWIHFVQCEDWHVWMRLVSPLVFCALGWNQMVGSSLSNWVVVPTGFVPTHGCPSDGSGVTIYFVGGEVGRVRQSTPYTIFGSENLGSLFFVPIWKPWKCTLFSGSTTLEVYYFGDWKPWKWILLSGLETLEVYTIFGTENLKPWNCTLFSDVKTSMPWKWL